MTNLRIFLWVLTTLLISPVWANEDFRQTYDFSAGQLLHVDLEPGGNLTVIGENRTGVEVSYPLTKGHEDFKLESTQKDDGLSLVGSMETRRSRFRLSMTIRVPQQSHLDLSTSGGNLDISQIDGDVEAVSMGGNAHIKKVNGAIALRTMGGNISVSDSELNGHVKTMGGNIDLRSTRGLVNCETMGGNINVDNKGTQVDSQASDPLTIKTMGGNISVDEAPTGLFAKTMGGNVSVGFSRTADIDTKGGNITIHELDGGVVAHTMGGAIRIGMVGDADDGVRDVELMSKGGDIVLSLPQAFSAEFDLEIEQTRRAKKEYRIKSDFELNVQKSGSYGSTIKATGQSLTGKNRVKIRTVNGDIIIKVVR